ncbi:hypothetical protein BpHYR1_017363 [Brachionus plicatilis]|uniref:Uncharacterized protein n=1 Tax=Brachionus plicatilis TaxID=10195 RepID=A0A3M7QUU4_BRAPC|nr:hypothetical protein BpHYR1_017363 [Brachionus plicatilis]
MLILNEIKKTKKKLQITIINYKFKNRKRKISFYKEIALVPVESSDAAKKVAKKALSKQSKPVEWSICAEFMKNEKGVKLCFNKSEEKSFINY